MPPLVLFTAIPAAAATAAVVIALILLAVCCCCRKRYAICMSKSESTMNLEPTVAYSNVIYSVPMGRKTLVQPPGYTEQTDSPPTYSELGYDDKDNTQVDARAFNPMYEQVEIVMDLQKKE